MKTHFPASVHLWLSIWDSSEQICAICVMYLLKLSLLSTLFSQNLTVLKPEESENYKIMLSIVNTVQPVI